MWTSFVVAVADTSVIIDHIHGPRVDAIDLALANDLLILPPLVIAELVTGAARDEEKRVIAELISTAKMHETDLRHWVAVGDLRRDLARHGVNLTIPDAHVVQCVIDLDATLIAHDKVFQLVAKHVPLRFA